MLENKIYSKVFLWMFLGLIVTFGIGYFVSMNERILTTIFSGGGYLLLVVAELGTVIFLSARINKMSITTARITFILYSFLTGLTFSSIFVVYKLQSIIFVFLIAALLFLIFGLIGMFINIDLSKLGSILLMMLVGIIICSVVNMFIGSESFNLALCIISLIIFLGFVAYDMQKVKRLYGQMDDDKLSIIMALELYLDFINIFLELIRLFGENRD